MSRDWRQKDGTSSRESERERDALGQDEIEKVVAIVMIIPFNMTPTDMDPCETK